MARDPQSPVLQASGLSVEFVGQTGHIAVVRDVELTLRPDETLAIVGESGSGKTVTLLAILGLHPPTRSCVVATTLRVCGVDILTAKPKQLQDLRGNRAAIVWQDPLTALNPYLTIGTQLAEVLVIHKQFSKADALDQAALLLGQVGLKDAGSILRQYPHEMSGGMRQRIGVAMALLCQPELLLADEPTTALDVTIQAQVLQVLADQRARTKLSLLLVTHDLGVVAALADRVAVMYGGQIVEQGTATAIFEDPRHPYTQALLASLPARQKRHGRLASLPGLAPPPQECLAGCAFAPRCAQAVAACRQFSPQLRAFASDRAVRCTVAWEGIG